MKMLTYLHLCNSTMAQCIYMYSGQFFHFMNQDLEILQNAEIYSFALTLCTLSEIELSIFHNYSIHLQKTISTYTCIYNNAYRLVENANLFTSMYSTNGSEYMDNFSLFEPRP